MESAVLLAVKRCPNLVRSLLNRLLCKSLVLTALQADVSCEVVFSRLPSDLQSDPQVTLAALKRQASTRETRGGTTRMRHYASRLICPMLMHPGSSELTCVKGVQQWMDRATQRHECLNKLELVDEIATILTEYSGNLSEMKELHEMLQWAPTFDLLAKRKREPWRKWVGKLAGRRRS